MTCYKSIKLYIMSRNILESTSELKKIVQLLKIHNQVISTKIIEHEIIVI